VEENDDSKESLTRGNRRSMKQDPVEKQKDNLWKHIMSSAELEDSNSSGSDSEIV